MNKLFSSAAAALTVAVLVLGAARPAAAVSEEQEIVEKARFTAERMFNDPDFGTMTDLMKDAKGILIVPSLLKAGFFYGIEGGTGVLLGRTADGRWSYPAFYTLGGLSIGFQFGGQAAEVVLLINFGLNQTSSNALKKPQMRDTKMSLLHRSDLFQTILRYFMIWILKQLV